MPDIVLASKSPRRRELFSYICGEFISCETDIDETAYCDLCAQQQVLRLAEDKCVAAAEIYDSAVVIGCDTLVELDGRVMGKPRDRKEAFEMVKELSGKTHRVYTGVAIWISGEITRFSVETEVTFRSMDDDEITEYIASGDSDDKAGAYGIQGMAARYIEGIKGDYFNVMGLPISTIYSILRKRRIV